MLTSLYIFLTDVNPGLVDIPCQIMANDNIDFGSFRHLLSVNKWSLEAYLPVLVESSASPSHSIDERVI